MKKIVVTTFQKNGDIETVASLGLRKDLVANDFEQAKKLVGKIIAPRYLGYSKYLVTWKRNGWDEGYLVSR